MTASGRRAQKYGFMAELLFSTTVLPPTIRFRSQNVGYGKLLLSVAEMPRSYRSYRTAIPMDSPLSLTCKRSTGTGYSVIRAENPPSPRLWECSESPKIARACGFIRTFGGTAADRFSAVRAQEGGMNRTTAKTADPPGSSCACFAEVGSLSSVASVKRRTRTHAFS